MINLMYSLAQKMLIINRLTLGVVKYPDTDTGSIPNKAPICVTTIEKAAAAVYPLIRASESRREITPSFKKLIST